MLETLNNLFDGFLVARLNKFIIQPARYRAMFPTEGMNQKGEGSAT